MERLSLLRIAALNAIAGSIDLIVAAEGAYFVPAILNIGVSPYYGAMLLSISPLASMILQNYVGSASDQCQCSWGRRKPFILVLSLISLLGIILFPFIEDIANFIHEDSRNAVLISLVIISTSISDSCGASLIQVPFRAYVLDVLPQKQIVQGNMVYSMCLSVGSAVGFGIGAVNWSTLFTSSDNFSLQVKFVFGLTLIITIVCTTATLLSVPERHQENGAFDKINKINSPAVMGGETEQIETKTSSSNSVHDQDTDSFDGKPGQCQDHDKSQASIEPSTNTSAANTDDINIVEENSSTSQSKSSFGWITMCVQSQIGSLRFQLFMSFPMVVLCIAVFFGLMAFFSQTFFFTNYVGEVTYDGDVSAPKNSTEYHNYTDGVKFGSLILGVSALVGMVISLLLGPLIKIVGMRPLFVSAYVIMMIQSGVLTLSPNRIVVFVISPAIAVMSTVTATFPYILASKYEAMKFMVRKSWPYTDAILLGRACGVLKFSGFAAQVMTLLVNGPLSDTYGSAVSVMIFTFVVSFCGAVVACFVTVPPTSLSSKKCLMNRTKEEKEFKNDAKNNVDTSTY